jgi:hypothetical protein
MKLPIPIVASCDVLFIGGTTPAVREALEARAAGASVFLATPFSSFGEDLCLTLDLQGAAADAFRRAAGLDHFATPFEVKRTLDRWVIDAGIGFLFGMHPVRPLAGAEGSFAGWVFGTRSGFVAVKAKTVVDATSRLQALESAGVAMAPFQPGRRTVSHILAGGAAEPREGLRVEALPVRFPDGPDHDTQLFRASIEFDFTDDTPATCAAATAALRFASWCGRTRAMSAVPSFGFERRTAAPLAPCAERPLFLPVAGAGRAAAALAKRLPDTAASSLRAAGGAADAAPPAAGEEIVRKDPSCRFGDRPTVDFVLAGFPVFDEVDVLVVGGGTAGAPAAIAAARAGARTLCLDALHALGGCMTVGRTSSYYYGRRVGFTREVDDGVYAMDADPFWKREDPFFDGGWKEAWFLREAVRAGASVWFGTQAVAALVACGGRRVAGAVVAGPHGCGIVRARVVVDATGAADVAAAAGAGTSSGDLAVEPALQGAGIPPVRLYSTYTNTDYQFIVDQDVVDATRAFVMSRAKFTDVFDVCPNLNTRERRRIVGDLTLQPQDFFANRRYRDTINVAYSNFDTHGFIVHPLFMIRPTAHDGHLAAIPLRALLPRGLEESSRPGSASPRTATACRLCACRPMCRTRAMRRGSSPPRPPETAARSVRSTSGRSSANWPPTATSTLPSRRTSTSRARSRRTTRGATRPRFLSVTDPPPAPTSRRASPPPPTIRSSRSRSPSRATPAARPFSPPPCATARGTTAGITAAWASSAPA